MKRLAAIFVFILSGCVSAPREACDPLGYQRKKVAFVMDEATAEALETHKLSLQAILISANWMFGRQEIPIRYDVKEIKVVSLDIKISSATALHDINDEESLRKIYFFTKDNLGPILAEELGGGNSDVAIMLSDDILTVNGAAISNHSLSKNFGIKGVRSGNGLVFIGSGKGKVFGWAMPQNNYEYLQKLAFTLVHEQAHLYGVSHSDDQDSIMYHEFISLESRFDPESLKKLQSALHAEYRQCARTRP